MIKNKIFILTLILGPVSAGAVGFDLFYDTNGECDTFCSIQHQGTGCCPDQSVVTEEMIAEKLRDIAATYGEEMSAVKLSDGTEFMDANGNLKMTGRQVNAKGAGETVSLRVTGSCTGTSERNSNGTCVDESGDTEYIDKSGGTMAPSNVGCWRYNNNTQTYDNYCHWNVNITFHDKPTSSSISGITSGNDGLKLSCTSGAGCKMGAGSTKNCCTPDSGNANTPPTCNTAYVQNPSSGSQATCQSISTPYADGYSFRGYFLNNNSGIVTQQTDMVNSAFSNFFPKNLNNRTISVTGHTVVIVDDEPVEIECTGTWHTRPDGSRYCDGSQTTAPINIDVYGGWARDCDESDPNAICNPTIGFNWNPTNGLKKGNVRYDTSCQNGYSVISGAGTYQPICQRETGNLTLNYVFKDQWGRTVPCSGMTGKTCELGGTYGFVTGDAVKSACGNDYTLKYMITNNQNWHKPVKFVSCSSNEFGSNRPATILGTVCKDFCTVGQHSDSLHGTCIAVNQGDTNPSMGVSLPQYYSNGGYYVIDTENIENLWDGCQTLQCDAGYGLVVDSNGPRCEVKQGTDPNFECPGKTTLTMPTNVAIGNPTLTNGTTCTYTIGCNQDYLDLMYNGSLANGNTITCIGTACANLQSQINAYSCQLHCPAASSIPMGHVNASGQGVLTNITTGAPTYVNGVCKYNVYCKDSGATLYHNGTVCNNCANQVTCNSYSDCYGDFMAGNPTYSILHDRFSEWDCPSASFTCPQTGLSHPAHGSVSYQGKSGVTCSYLVTCEGGYEPATGTVTCAGETDCENNLNTRLSAFTCSLSQTTPTRIMAYYHGSGSSSNPQYCTIGEANSIMPIPRYIGTERVYAFKYTNGAEPNTIFIAGETAPCEVGSGGFTQYTVNGDLYVVDLTATQPPMTQIQIKYTVTLPEGYLGGGLTSGVCTQTDTCTVGQNVMIADSINCSGTNVPVSMWAVSGAGTNLGPTPANCTSDMLHPTYNEGVYTSTLVGTIAQAGSTGSGDGGENNDSGGGDSE